MKKGGRPPNFAIIAYFGFPNLYKKTNEAQQIFIEDLVLYICKCYLTFLTTKNIWLRKLVLHQCPHVSFSSWIVFVDEVFFAMVKETLDLHVFPNLAFVITISYNFDIQMFKGGMEFLPLW